MDMSPTPLCHGPAPSCGTVQRHIDGTKVFRICNTTVARTCPSVVGRKNAADKGNDGQPVASVIAQGVDIPPEITTRRDRLVETRFAMSVAAANRPDMAAIGTPGPGCTLPPARYKPASLLREAGR